MLNLIHLAKPTGRFLVCIGEAQKPMSEGELIKAVEKRHERSYSIHEARAAFAMLKANNIINDELELTQEGLQTFEALKAHSAKGGRYHKFFRLSENPDVGPRAIPMKAPLRAASAGLLTVR